MLWAAVQRCWRWRVGPSFLDVAAASRFPPPASRFPPPASRFPLPAVELPNRNLVLRRLSVWSRRFGLFEGEKQIGSIYPVGLFTRRANIDLPADWPLAQRIFLFWLAFLMWRRQNQAAAS